MKYQYGGDQPGIKARMGREPRPFDPALCGSEKGIWQHRREKESNCEKCRTWYNAKRRNAWHAAKSDNERNAEITAAENKIGSEDQIKTVRQLLPTTVIRT